MTVTFGPKNIYCIQIVVFCLLIKKNRGILVLLSLLCYREQVYRNSALGSRPLWPSDVCPHANAARRDWDKPLPCSLKSGTCGNGTAWTPSLVVFFPYFALKLQWEEKGNELWLFPSQSIVHLYSLVFCSFLMSCCKLLVYTVSVTLASWITAVLFLCSSSHHGEHRSPSNVK